jgi:flagellar assembly protein FliH
LSSSKVIEQNEAGTIVLDYVPQIFPVVISNNTNDFISSKTTENSDFQMSEVISEQVGIIALRKRNIEAKLEDQILVDLKGIEEKAYKEAYDLGFIEGENKAYEEKQAEIEERLVVMDEFLENSQGLYRKLFEKNESLLIKMLFSFASEIAMKEISNNTDEIIGIVKKTMEYIQGDIRSLVIISEEDKDFLEEIKKNISKDYEFLDKVEVNTSAELTKGGCIIETNFGIIDASVEERVKKVWQSVQEKTPTSDEDVITDE